jgi:hypothetical protein
MQTQTNFPSFHLTHSSYPTHDLGGHVALACTQNGWMITLNPLNSNLWPIVLNFTAISDPQTLGAYCIFQQGQLLHVANCIYGQELNTNSPTKMIKLWIPWTIHLIIGANIKNNLNWPKNSKNALQQTAILGPIRLIIYKH